jgi:hypothetical protein
MLTCAAWTSRAVPPLSDLAERGRLPVLLIDFPTGPAGVRHVQRASWQRDGPVNLPGQGRAGCPGGLGGFVAHRVVIGDLRVQPMERGGRGRSFTIVWPDGAVHEAADRFLRGYEGSGTQRTYAYLLLDHLRWLEREALATETVSLQDLRRYMAALGAAWRGPYGQPWRAGRRPFGQSALSAAAACVKGFYLHQALLGVNPELGSQMQPPRRGGAGQPGGQSAAGPRVRVMSVCEKFPRV